MFIVDEMGTLLPYLGDQGRKIPNAHLKLICKIDGPGTCRYACRTAIGWVCAKNTPAKSHVDKAVNDKVFKRNTGDNCEGFGSLLT